MPVSIPSRRLAALLLAVLLAPEIAVAQPAGPCWKRPEPETVQEMVTVSGLKAAQKRQAKREQGKPADAVLLISNGAQKIAYSAGLLVGWGDIGERPRFAAVTGAGAGALIAPFAFIGQAGDQAMADIVNCETRDFDELATFAGSLIDDAVLAAIAREHQAGRRLFIGLPGSPARTETVLDIGRLAASRQPGALALLREVLRASVFLHGKLPAPPPGSEAFVQTFPPNPAFRMPGAGREFLLPAQLASVTGAGTRYYLIHNDRLFWDESEEYIRGAASAGPAAAASPIMPGYDVIRRALKVGGFRAALPKVSATLIPNDEFDPAYLRALFQRAYRQSRMDREWVEEYPGLRLGRSGL